MPIVTLDEVLQRYGNVLDIMTKDRTLTIGVDGTDNFRDYKYIPDLRDEVTIDTPLTDYPRGSTYTIYYLGHPNVEGFPGNAGLLFTMKASNSYNYQDFIPLRSTKAYRRVWLESQSRWTEFELYIGENFDSEVTATKVGDWEGTIKLRKNDSNNLVQMHGRIIVGTQITPNQTLFEIPLDYTHNDTTIIDGFTIVPAFNHTKLKPIYLFITNLGHIRLAYDSDIDVGDSIRINYLYKVTRL